MSAEESKLAEVRFEDPALSEQDVRRLWEGTQSRVRAQNRRPQQVALAALMLLGAISAGAWSRWAQGAEPIRLASGAAPVAARDLEAPAHILFDDRSELTLAEGSRWWPTANEPGRFESELEVGDAHFDIVPNGPRSWVIQAGPAEIEVLGTAFRVVHSAEAVEVSVERGRVRVRAMGRAPVELGAGESVSIAAASEENEATSAERASLERPTENQTQPEPGEPIDEGPGVEAAPPIDSNAIASETASDLRMERTARAPRERGWREVLREDEPRDALADLRPRLDRILREATPEEQMRLADLARMSGDVPSAIRALEALAFRAGEHPLAAPAAVALGRLERDRSHRPERARRAFERAIHLAPSANVSREAEAGLESLQVR